jgi:PBP1b-binding outer membrane lipoprotein LpoB
MHRIFLVLFGALALAGCISFSSSNPSPPPSTVVVPAR